MAIKKVKLERKLDDGSNVSVVFTEDELESIKSTFLPSTKSVFVNKMDEKSAPVVFKDQWNAVHEGEMHGFPVTWTITAEDIEKLTEKLK